MFFFAVVTWQKKSLRFYWPRYLDTPFSYFRVHPVIRITLSTQYFFNISVNTFSCSWPEDKYGNWIPKWVTWPLLWQLSIRLNLYNMVKLLLKFPINMLLIYRDRPPPLFFHVVYPFHIRSVSTARTASRSSQNSWFTSKRTARHVHAGTFLEHWLADYDVNLPNAK